MPYVPVRWQAQEAAHYCGPAVVRIILSTFTPDLPDQDKLAELSGTTEHAGTSRFGMWRAIRAVQPDAPYLIRETNTPLSVPQRELFLADVDTTLALGHPLAVNLTTRANGYTPSPVGLIDHWVALVGLLAEGHALLCDPASDPRPVYPIPLTRLVSIIERMYLTLDARG